VLDHVRAARISGQVVMSNRLDRWINEWASDLVYNLHRSGFSGINVVERLLKDPGKSTRGCGHVVLWWPKTKRIAKVSKAMHRVSKIEQVVLIVDCDCILNEDNTIFTKHDLAKNSSIGVRKFNGLRRKSKNKLSEILGA